MKLVSWNVNGLRAVLRKNFLEFLEEESPDILCLQETKAGPNDVEQLWPTSYTTYWNTARKRGYAGTAIFSRVRPLRIVAGMENHEHDSEGRLLTAEYAEWFVVNVYVPNSKQGLERLPYRQKWDRDFLAYLRNLESAKPVIVCGDLNVAHTELDIAHPARNVGSPGYTPQERQGFSALLDSGFIDTFREFEKGGGHYTWWSPFSEARQRNAGWRIDYVVVSRSLRSRLVSAFIRCNTLGSDHCPVGIELDSRV